MGQRTGWGTTCVEDKLCSKGCLYFIFSTTYKDVDLCIFVDLFEDVIFLLFSYSLFECLLPRSM